MARSPLRYQADRIAAACCALLGLIFLLFGWWRISDTPYPAEQLPYILSGGIGGIFLLGLAATLWISSDLRDEWSKLDRLEDAMRELLGEPSPTSQGTPDDTVVLEPAQTDSQATDGNGSVAGPKRRRRTLRTSENLVESAP